MNTDRKKFRLVPMLALAAATAVIAFSPPAEAQTNTNTTTISTNTASQDILGLLGLSSTIVNTLEASGITAATNWAVAPYLTYSSAAANHVGGGFLASYNFPALTGTNGSVGAALGADWLGNWSLVSANVTLKLETHPLNIGLLSFLPANLTTNLAGQPLAVLGVGAPMSGSSGAATLWDVGYNLELGKYLVAEGMPTWLNGFGLGGTWGEWENAGKESGHREHFFIDYKWKLPEGL
jgi:hypothetical protein